jgi:hypothetical protein
LFNVSFGEEDQNVKSLPNGDANESGDADNEGSLTAQPKLLKVPVLTYDYLPMYNIWLVFKIV